MSCITFISPEGREIYIENYIKLQNKLVIKHDYSADTDMGFSDGDTEYERNQYYFFNDHLGSSSIVSDFGGLPTHHIEYMPFGESFVNMKYSTWATPYTFNAKEQDCETGLHYYGARYYDARVGRFMSVDPLADQMPAHNPYHYSYNNPVMYSDYTGLCPDEKLIAIDGSSGNLRSLIYIQGSPAGSLVNMGNAGVDDWVEDKNGKIYWDKKATSQATTKKGEKYLGMVFIDFKGSTSESPGQNGKLNEPGAIPAQVTVYGPKGQNDIQTYDGLTVSSDPSKYSMIPAGDYEANYQPMATGVYGDNKGQRKKNPRCINLCSISK